MTKNRQRPTRPLAPRLPALATLLGLVLGGLNPAAQATGYPVTAEQRQTAEQVAQAGVPLSELAPDAPDTYTVKSGDTLWAISSLFLKSPWRWPELWGMNKEQIRNPHLIYPEQVLMLVRKDGRAMLQLARNAGGAAASGGAAGSDTIKLSPRVRRSDVGSSAIEAIPQHLIQPFLTEAVVFDTDQLERAPRIIAAPESRVMMTQGDLAYARGNLGRATEFRIFRKAQPLRDPTTKEILGYEAAYMGTAELLRAGSENEKNVVPATLRVNAVRQEIGVGDRLAEVEERGFTRYIPHPPSAPLSGQIISIYGEALTGGQNQIVALNRGRKDGLERGHVLALWRAGRTVRDNTNGKRESVRLPDEQHGTLFVFQVYQRVAYALILSVKEPVSPGDRFSQP